MISEIHRFEKHVPVVGHQVTPQQVGPHHWWQPDRIFIVLRGENRHFWKNLVSFGAKKPTLVGGFNFQPSTVETY